MGDGCQSTVKMVSPNGIGKYKTGAIPGLEAKEIKKGTRHKMPKSLFLHGAETQS